MSKEVVISQKHIENRIFTIRGNQVMIDRDLAEMYQVEVKRLNEQVKRNFERFPESFRFLLSHSEKDELVSNCDRIGNLKSQSVTSNSRLQNVIFNKSVPTKAQIIKHLQYALKE